MALSKAYTNNYGKIGALLTKIREGTAPETFNRAHLRDLDFKSSHDFPMIQVLKELGFLAPDGKPTPQYMEYLDKSKHKKVLGQAVSTSYSDIFVIKAKPTKNDIAVVEGKFKSEFNSSDQVAKARASTFFALLNECEIDKPTKDQSETEEDIEDAEKTKINEIDLINSNESSKHTFHYNIQIHLPPTKDIEVYNSIFKSLKEHLLD